MEMIQFSRGRSFDPATGEVSCGGRRTRLEPQPADLLALLAARPDRLVTHEEIREQLWRDGRHVDQAAGVHYAVRQIRRALDDGATHPPDIETLPRRGYRLMGTAIAPPPGGTHPADAPTTSPRGWKGPLLWTAAALTVVSLVTVVERRPNDHHARAVAIVRAVHDAIY